MITYLEGVHDEDERLQKFFLTACDLLREKDVKIICLSGGHAEQNLKSAFPSLEDATKQGHSVMYFDWSSQLVVPFPLNLHNRATRK